MMSKNRTHVHRGEELEDPPKGHDSGFSRLVWNLRAYGYPITLESVKYVREYLEKTDLEPQEANYQEVAQWVSQNKDIDFETNNYYGTTQMRFSDY